MHKNPQVHHMRAGYLFE